MIFSALAFYDSILTLEDERRFVWARKFSLASCIFLANRVANVMQIIAYALQTGIAVCSALIIAVPCCIYIPAAKVGLILFLRLQ